MKASRISIVIIGLIAIIGYLSIFTVFEIKNAIVLQFGDPKRVIMEPGLNFKIPFVQNVVSIDNRILDIDELFHEKYFYPLKEICENLSFL